MTVQVIEATKPLASATSPGSANRKRLRVAAYCRVSTDSDEQETSFEGQVIHYTDYIKSNPRWMLAGIYADEGISGTSTHRREQFNAHDPRLRKRFDRHDCHQVNQPLGAQHRRLAHQHSQAQRPRHPRAL